MILEPAIALLVLSMELQLGILLLTPAQLGTSCPGAVHEHVSQEYIGQAPYHHVTVSTMYCVCMTVYMACTCSNVSRKEQSFISKYSLYHNLFN